MSPYMCISWFLFNQGIIQKLLIIFSLSYVAVVFLAVKFVSLKTRTEFGHFSQFLGDSVVEQLHNR